MPSFIYRRLLATALLCLAAAHALADTSPLRVKISSGAAAGSVNVVLTNQGTESLSILRWDTPFENVLSDDVFAIVQPRKGVLFNYPALHRAACKTCKRPPQKISCY